MSNLGSKSLRIISWPILAILAWFLGYRYNLNDDLELGWVNSIYSQKLNLSQQEDRANRILLFGGSGTHMGLDAYTIEKQIGLPVYNFGLHAGLGLNGIISNIYGQIKPGDIIILIPEFDLLSRENTTGRLAVPMGLKTGRLAYLNLPPQELSQEILEVGTPTLRTFMGSLLELILDRNLVDYYSDEVDSRGSPLELKLTEKELSVGKFSEPISESALQQIQEVSDAVKSAGGKFVIVLSWMYYSGDLESEKNAKQLVQTLETIAPVLYGENFNLKTDRTLFGDTIFHMSYAGREARSLELAKQIESILK